jgi:superfamily II DNA or RNA helicase
VIKLRTYQQDGIAGIRQATEADYRRIAYTGPCGMGKTMIFSYIAHEVWSRHKRITILVHRGELVDQVDRALDAVSVPHSFQAAGYDYRDWAVQVATVQTLARRLDGRYPAPDVIIVDECHHISAAQYKAILAAWPDALVLGFTATLCRLGGDPLGNVFDYHVPGPTTPDLQMEGWLAPCVQYTPESARPLDMSSVPVRGGDYVKQEMEIRLQQSTVTGDAVAHYRKYAHQKPCVVFCPTIAECERTAQMFCDAGYAFASVDGKMSHQQQKKITGALGKGLHGVVSCSLIDEGYDCPVIECGIDLRPTKSLSRYLQAGGRILRVSHETGKTHATWIDPVGNWAASDKNGQFGRIDEARFWTLDIGAVSRKREAPLRKCPFCFGDYEGGPVCPYCGKVATINEKRDRRGLRVVDGQLIEAEHVDRSAPSPRKQMYEEAKQLRGLQAFQDLAKEYGMSSHWAHSMWKRSIKRKRPGTQVDFDDRQTVIEEPRRTYG